VQRKIRNTLLKIVAPIILTFLLTTLVGNWLIQKWQASYWLRQQRFSGNEKEYSALKELVDEIAALLGARMYCTQRLCKGLGLDDDAFQQRVQEHDSAVKQWNEKLTSFYVRLRLLAAAGSDVSLESNVHYQFVNVQAELDRLVRHRRTFGNPDYASMHALDRKLNHLQGKITRFNDAMMKYVMDRKSELYFGTVILFDEQNLHHFSTWALFKALFVRDIRTLTITRSSLDA
jgi:hypothetical protein